MGRASTLGNTLGSLNPLFGGIKQCKSMVNLRDFTFFWCIVWVGDIMSPDILWGSPHFQETLCLATHLEDSNGALNLAKGNSGFLIPVILDFHRRSSAFGMWLPPRPSRP